MPTPPLTLPSGRSLRPLRVSDAAELHALIDANRAHLRPWMPWAHDEDFAGTLEFLTLAAAQEEAQDGFQAAIVDADGAIVGVAGFHGIDRARRSTSIGYWLAEHVTGRGIMTEAVAALVGLAFAEWELNRIEIRAAPGNRRSRRVAERLGFVEEGVLREAELHPDGFRDIVLYALLRRDRQGR